MQIVLYVLAAVLMLAGVYGLFMGWDIIMVERGWSQFIAGATSFSAGVIVLALAHVAKQVQLLRNDISGLVVEVEDTPATPDAPASKPIADQAASESIPAIKSAASSSDAESQNAATAPLREMVGSYASGGVTYFMYGDHSIEAELPEGRFRFASMEELRTYLDTGAGGVLVRKGAPEPQD